MFVKSIEFKDNKCFKENFGGYREVKPINVIIGRNNSGKSRMLDFAKVLCESSLCPVDWDCRGRATFSHEALSRCFAPGASGGELGGRHWADHGIEFRDKDFTWRIDAGDTQIQIGEIKNYVPHNVASVNKGLTPEATSCHHYRGLKILK